MLLLLTTTAQDLESTPRPSDEVRAGGIDAKPAFGRGPGVPRTFENGSEATKSQYNLTLRGSPFAGGERHGFLRPRRNNKPPHEFFVSVPVSSQVFDKTNAASLQPGLYERTVRPPQNPLRTQNTNSRTVPRHRSSLDLSAIVSPSLPDRPVTRAPPRRAMGGEFPAVLLSVSLSGPSSR